MRKLWLFLFLMTLSAFELRAEDYINGKPINEVLIQQIGILSNQIDTTYSRQDSFSMNAVSSTNFALTGNAFNVPYIMRGRLYVSNTNNNPFSKTVTLTFRDRSSLVSEAALWQSDMLMSGQYITNAISIGDTNVYISDATDFSANNLMYVGGTTPEFIRILTISGNNIIFKYACTNTHAISNICSVAKEIGMFKLNDTSLNKTIWGSLEFTNATTINLKLDLDYTK